ncbi:MAG: carbon-nitrogen hydrolase [Candidatus Micrarchaeota archaeon]|nr:carbon-nitrogen hydrolase [Candidatus Micrarchaeota archaeon]MDE1834175.1 carbon-nitrogen hydrolase [Candidatus Micrarchaeota archaeon]MDE1859695.1 carbon-nitrogen hydrolase [Candidatus Micrarchaeota archaeon]
MPKKIDNEEVTIGLIQMSMSESPQENLDKALKRIDEAAKKGANIICLPELFKSRYFCQEENAENFALAETIPGDTTEAISKSAKKNDTAVIAGIFEKRTRGLYHNSSVVIDATGKLIGMYRKMHIPDDPSFYEKFYFTPGDLGFKAYNTKYAKVGTLICWDQWYPEAARLTSLLGAQILFYPTAIGWLPGEEEAAKEMKSAWETIQRSHGIANGVFVAAVNRVGKEGNMKFWGSSFISGPFGEIIAKASPDKEEILLAKCDLSTIDSTRQGWPFLRDRRIDAYKGITSRFLD